MLKGALLGQTQVSPTNIRLGWKAYQEPNTLAYYKNSYIKDKKSFITFASGFRLFLIGWFDLPFHAKSTFTQKGMLMKKKVRLFFFKKKQGLRVFKCFPVICV
jgi:hypothetical protein